jgi:predicted Zn-dependent protease
MLQLMNMLQQEAAGKEPAAFMSTHPVFKDRLENIRAQMKNFPTPSSGNRPDLSKLFHDLYENW